MAIYSRRTIQRLIDESASFLSRKELKDIVDKLNEADKAKSKGEYPTLAGEWELVILNALNKLGKVENEKKFAWRQPLDVYFELREDTSQSFLADIVTLSDKGFDGRYPLQQFIEKLFDKFLEHGFDRRNSFSFRIEGDGSPIHKGHYYSDKDQDGLLYKGGLDVKLHISPIREIEDLVFKRSEFIDFLNRIKSSRNRKDHVRIFDVEKKLNFAIEYNPHQSGSMISNPYYKYITNITKTRLYAELEEKAYKLKKAEYSGPLGVIVCDGGYSPFRHNPDWHAHSAKEVIFRFLELNREISFVLLLKIEQPFSGSTHEVEIDLLTRIDPIPLSEGLMGALHSLPTAFHSPEQDTVNAMNILQSRRSYVKASIGLQMRENVTVTVSTRKALMILAGKLSPDALMEEKLLAHWLERGKVISNVKFIKSENEKDDDQIELTLSGPDPSITEFVLPTEGKFMKNKIDRPSRRS